MRSAQKVEYLKAFETKVENISARFSGAQMSSFNKTTFNRKPHASVILIYAPILFNWSRNARNMFRVALLMFNLEQTMQSLYDFVAGV
jgi:hypothetical protein